jgi:DNA-binding response OmpR family regulator
MIERSGFSRLTVICMKILVVDTDDSVSFTLALGLTHQCHVVNLTSSAQTGLDLAKIHHYDAIVMDALLPDLDGLNFCRQLRASGKQTPILFLSCDSELCNCLHRTAKGENTCVSKAVSDNELVANVLGQLQFLDLREFR